jgi:membrane fusion protein (multidrug efflux system)
MRTTCRSTLRGAAAVWTTESALATLLILLLLVPGLSLTGCSAGGGDSAAADDSTAVAAASNGDEENGEAETAAEDDTSSTEAKPKARSREKVITVNAAKAIRGDLVIPVIAEGTIRAPRSTEVRTEITGRVDRVQVKEGQRVRRGQILAQLDDREYRVAHDEAQANYLQALGRLAVDDDGDSNPAAAADLEARVKELEEMERTGALTHDEVQKKILELEVKAVKGGAYRDELVEVRSGMSAARAAVKRAELNLEHTTLTAPFDGVVKNVTLSAGEWVTVQQHLCDLVDNLNVEADVAVLESDLAGVEIGRPVLLEVPALAETLRVEVDVISPEVEAATRTCEVLMRFKNDSGRYRPGMFVRAIIAGRSFPDRLLVPKEAILTRDGRPLLFKIEDDQAKWVYVRLGGSNDRFVEIERVLQGGPLDAGTLVVVSDHLTLTHDAKVKVRDLLEPTPLWSARSEE